MQNSTSSLTDLLQTKTTKYPTIAINKTKNNCYRTTDLVFVEVQDLTCPAYRAWYCKMIHRLGRDKILRLASIARQDGNDPARLFSYLIKNAAKGSA